MNKLFACISFFNDEPELFEKSLRSIKSFGIPIIAIDGKYKDFPCEWNSSNDVIINLAKQYSDYYISAPAWGWQNQAQKRTLFLKVIPDDSYIFVIDADEELVTFAIPELFEDHYIVHIQDNGDLDPTIRIHKKYYDLEYLYSHYRLYRLRDHDPNDSNSNVVTKAFGNDNAIVLSGVILQHNKHLRSIERKKQKQIYYGIRNEMKNSGLWPKKETCPTCRAGYYGNICPYCLT